MKSNTNKSRLIKAVICVLSLGALASAANAQGLNDIPWMTNVEQAKRLAQQENKMVLLHFGASWCRPCRSLDNYVFNSATVKRAISENVVPVKLDADVAIDMVNEYDVSSVPYDVMITPAGRVVAERRSPSESDNYAKMISSVASASRKLQQEKLGPIAHQHDLATNPLASHQPTDFRVNGPQVDELELPQHAAQMQRRQNASLVANSTPKSVRKTNPWVDAAGSAAAQTAGTPSTSSLRETSLSLDDLQRNEFLNRERAWVAPAAARQTRRAKPERIVNERYFETLAKKQPSVPPSNRVASLKSDDFSVNDTVAEISSAAGEFNPSLNLSSPNKQSVDLSVSSPDLLDLEPAAPEIVTDAFCLSGKCPVTLLTEGRWVDGDPEFGIVHRDRTYIFANAQKLALFRSNPDKYSPILAGYDPVVYHEEGKLVEGLVENGVFMGKTDDQKVVLFSNDETRGKFQSQPKMYLETIRIATMNARKNRVR